MQLDGWFRRMEENSELRFIAAEKQMKKMTQAFGTLSDAVLEEVDGLREETNEKVANVEARIEVYAHEMKKLKQYVKENGGGKRPGDMEVEHTVLDTLAEELEAVRKDASKIHQTNTRLDLVEQKYVSMSGKLEGTASMAANADRWVREMKEDSLIMREDIDKSRDAVSGAAAALAQDIAALADDAAVMRDDHSKLQADTQKRLVALAEIIEAQHEADTSTVENKFEDLLREVRENNESIRGALRVSLKQQNRLKATLSDGLTNMGRELGATAKHSKLLEEELRKEVMRMTNDRDMQTQEVQSQFEAMSTALNAFADLLQVSIQQGNIGNTINGMPSPRAMMAASGAGSSMMGNPMMMSMMNGMITNRPNYAAGIPNQAQKEPANTPAPTET